MQNRTLQSTIHCQENGPICLSRFSQGNQEIIPYPWMESQNFVKNQDHRVWL